MYLNIERVKQNYFFSTRHARSAYPLKPSIYKRKSCTSVFMHFFQNSKSIVRFISRETINFNKLSIITTNAILNVHGIVTVYQFATGLLRYS